jgi:hypothetical protein
MDKISMSRKSLEVEFKGNRCMGQSRTRWSGQVLKELVRIENNCGKKEEIGDFVDPYKLEAMIRVKIMLLPDVIQLNATVQLVVLSSSDGLICCNKSCCCRV